MESISPSIAGQSTPLELIRVFGSRQHGVVARWQLLQAGVDEDVIERLLDGERLLRVQWGVYGVGHRPLGARSREMAVVLLAGKRGALAWHSSAAMWAMTRPWRGPVHAIGPSRARARGL